MKKTLSTRARRWVISQDIQIIPVTENIYQNTPGTLSMHLRERTLIKGKEWNRIFGNLLRFHVPSEESEETAASIMYAPFSHLISFHEETFHRRMIVSDLPRISTSN